jgi:hypothetical protein
VPHIYLYKYIRNWIHSRNLNSFIPVKYNNTFSRALNKSCLLYRKVTSARESFSVKDFLILLHWVPLFLFASKFLSQASVPSSQASILVSLSFTSHFDCHLVAYFQLFYSRAPWVSWLLLQPAGFPFAPPSLWQYCLHDSLCGILIRVPGYRSRGPGSIPRATTFSEKEWVWDGVHSASWAPLKRYLEVKISAPV